MGPVRLSPQAIAAEAATRDASGWKALTRKTQALLRFPSLPVHRQQQQQDPAPKAAAAVAPRDQRLAPQPETRPKSRAKVRRDAASRGHTGQRQEEEEAARGALAAEVIKMLSRVAVTRRAAQEEERRRAHKRHVRMQQQRRRRVPTIVIHAPEQPATHATQAEVASTPSSSRVPVLDSLAAPAPASGAGLEARPATAAAEVSTRIYLLLPHTR